MVKQHLVDAVAECLACGLSESDVRNIVENTITSGVLPYEAPKKKK
jgi:nucleoid DNA-binding protein